MNATAGDGVLTCLGRSEDQEWESRDPGRFCRRRLLRAAAVLNGEKSFYYKVIVKRWSVFVPSASNS